MTVEQTNTQGSPVPGHRPWYAVVDAVAWFFLFVAGDAWRISKDTARVWFAGLA